MHGAMGAHDPQPHANCGRRASPRLRLQLPAELVTLDGRDRAVLENVSATGARVLSNLMLRPGACCILRLPGLELFADVTWCMHGRLGLIFEQSLSQDQLLALRNLNPTDLSNERAASKDWARAFVNGTIGRRV